MHCRPRPAPIPAGAESVMRRIEASWYLPSSVTQSSKLSQIALVCAVGPNLSGKPGMQAGGIAGFELIVKRYLSVKHRRRRIPSCCPIFQIFPADSRDPRGWRHRPVARCRGALRFPAGAAGHRCRAGSDLPAAAVADAQPDNLPARGGMLVVSCLAGIAFSHSMIGMVH